MFIFDGKDGFFVSYEWATKSWKHHGNIFPDVQFNDTAQTAFIRVNEFKLYLSIKFQNNINFELVAPPNTFSISQGACGSYPSTARLAQVPSAAAHLMYMQTHSEENEADNLIVTGDCAHLLNRRPDPNPIVDSFYVFMNLKSTRVCNFKFDLLD
jgi:hypothetical protein